MNKFLIKRFLKVDIDPTLIAIFNIYCFSGFAMKLINLLYSCPLEGVGGKLEILLRESDGLILAERYEK